MNPLIDDISRSLKLRFASPQAAEKVTALAEAYGSQMAQQAGAQAVQMTLNPNAVEKASQQYKQSIFQRPGAIR